MEKYFRGTWLRPEVYLLLERRIIDCKEFAFLAVIDGATDLETGGCCAPNSYFAKILGTTSQTVEKMIIHLKEIGWIHQVESKEHKRLIITASMLPFQKLRNIRRNLKK